jgi:uncharacterized membrane protein YeaQ/YmgE (transglycosylase-associated protein family)
VWGLVQCPWWADTGDVPFYSDEVILALFVLIAILLVLALAGWAVWLLISTAIVGLVIGGLGRLVIPGRQPIGLLATVVVGLVGSVLGTLIGHEIGLGRLVTVVLEVAIAAIGVAIVAGSRSRQVWRRNHHVLTRGW